ncbi:MAG TPA: hypothetical protein DD734_04040 [Firmicutes bacterium]|nr:hypothetical protein [Bacillota bacterium]
MLMCDAKVKQSTSDQADQVLENLHRLQRPGEFTPLAAACGWIKKETPSGLLEDIMAQIHWEEILRQGRQLCLTGMIFCVLYFIFFATSINPVGTGEHSATLVGGFWLLASLGFCFLLLAGFLLGYRINQEVRGFLPRRVND